MKKSDLNGEEALPLYGYLKTQKGFQGYLEGHGSMNMRNMLEKVDKNYKNNLDIKWNFTKFIVDRSGNVVARFETTEDMKKVEDFVRGLL